MDCFKKYNSTFFATLFKSLFEGVDDIDPMEEIKSEDLSLKIALVFIFLIGIFNSNAFLYFFGFLLMGLVTIALRIYSTEAQEQGNVIGRELLCAWRSGDLVSELLFFWPFDLLTMIVLMFFGKSRISFSEEYRRMCFRAYSSNKGIYHGMHLDTAIQFSDRDVNSTAEEVEDVVIATKEKSRIVIMYGSLVSFVIAPLNFIKANMVISEFGSSVTGYFSAPNQSANFFGYLLSSKALLVNVSNRLRRLFSILYQYICIIIWDKGSKERWILPPIRFIPNLQIMAIVISTPVNGPPAVY